MNRTGIFGMALGVALLAGCSSAPREIEISEATTIEGLAEEFNNISASGEFYFAGYPTVEGLEAMHRRGVRTIVSTKAPAQVDEKLGESEREVAERLGMRIVYLPITPDSFSSRDVDRLSDLIEHNEGPVLLHCGSSNTIGGLWAAYLHRERGVDASRALEIGQSAGLRSESMREAAQRVMASH